jgi:hypothetical protein
VSKTPPPLLGFNNNVRHRGRVFHIQTEDSGIKAPRIVTHLFADGGRIVRTTRTDYSEHVGRDDMAQVVRKLMKEQHKGMFIALRAGELDQVIEDACGLLLAPEPPRRIGEMPSQPELVELGTPAPDSLPAAQSFIADSLPADSLPADADPLPAAALAADATGTDPPARARSLSNPNLRRVVPSVPPPAAGSIELDVESLDRHPPPPAVPRAPRIPTPAAARSASERYAPSRPAAIFGEIPPPESGSIFGEGVSEKSLDEVILSYLAEDLEGSPSK